MKKTVKVTNEYFGDCLIPNEEIKKRTEELAREYEEKLKRKQARLNAVANCFKAIFFTPLSIGTKVISFVCKLIGSVLSLGLPYGIYCVYKTVTQLCNGIALSQISQTTFACVFFIFPFIAFGVAFLFEQLSDFFECGA